VLADDFPAVLRAAARGDEGEFARLWRDAHPPLRRYLRVIAGDHAEDIASDVWVEVAGGLPGFTGDESAFRGWLFTLGRRRAVDRWRAKDRRPEVLTASLEPIDRASADDTETAVMDALSSDAALALIATLPRQQAEIIALRVVAGLDVDQVAKLLGKSPGSVRVAAHRGLRTLAARLAADRQGVTQ
jgi:RNA polymerase sigma-70 factor (ECF subfamily)